MINIVNKEDCCGCYACGNVCPKGCISMVEDREGFNYPNVSQDDCINCNLCEKVCPIINKDMVSLGENEEDNTYAAYSKNATVRKNSSSGGIFTELAESVLKNNGVVFGVAFDDNLTAHHIMVDSIDGLEKLRGSKYIQSQIEDTYKEAEKLLNKDILVLFSGVACQIAGLKAFLRKDYDNLLTVDVLCHGVPSGKVWRKYIDYQQKRHNSAIKEFYFRNKDNGWKVFTIKQKYADKKEDSCAFNKDPFMQMFLGEVCLRPSCHNCKYKDINRPSDITLGDSWGIQNYMPDMDDDNGTSVVIAHTEKGNKFINSIKDNLVVKKAELDKILPPTADSRKSVLPHKNREIFFKAIEENKSIDELALLVKDRFTKHSLLFRLKRKIKKVIKR